MRVFVLCANPLLGEGLASLLKYSGGYDVVGRDSRFVPADLREREPDVLLLTEDMLTDEVRTALSAGTRDFRASVAVIARDPKAASFADAVIEPSLGSGDLFARLRGLPLGGAGASRNGNGATDEAKRLSPREKEVARLIASGLSNRQIAEKLGIQEQSIKNCVSSLMSKLGVDNRVQILLRVQESGALAD
jgi:DNA-binding NarL/FixJ family response regulator